MRYRGVHVDMEVILFGGKKNVRVDFRGLERNIETFSPDRDGIPASGKKSVRRVSVESDAHRSVFM